VAAVRDHRIILRVLNIYRRYYGTRMAVFLAGTFYASAALAGYAVELLFGGAGLIPRFERPPSISGRTCSVTPTGIS